MPSLQSTVIFILSAHLAHAIPAKLDRPVHEIINEQARMDEDLKPPSFTYVNPLAGNSKQNAKLHAQHQQAMFNAERVRQHRAQIQRWTKAPQQTDSYMKAFQESQENHQLALEQLHLRNANEPMKLEPKVRQKHIEKPEHSSENIKQERRPTERIPQKNREITRTEQKQEENVERGRTDTGRKRSKQGRTRQEQVPSTQNKRLEQSQTTGHELQRTTKLPSAAPTKLTRADAITSDRNRRHRSHGSVDYQLLQPRKYQAVFLSPGPTYDQGVTIKPNGNVGLTHLKTVPEESKLYTSAIPSKTQHVFPKQYHQMQNYQSAQDIDTLSSLLRKTPTEQLSELSALLNSGNTEMKSNLPIDLLFYLKDKPAKALPQSYNPSIYSQIPQYANTFMPEIRDHTPITEELDDIEDPNRYKKLKTYGLKPVLATPPLDETVETTTAKNNFYKIQTASQTIPSSNKPLKFYTSLADHEEVNPTYQTFQYTEPVGYYSLTDGDLSEKYLHHNAHVGLHHLTDDGAVSYDTDDLQYAANYEFGYHVKDLHSGNDFGHAEARHGDNTNGQYHVVLPDGRRQRVLYSAGPEGFHADVSYEHLI